jgi:hypothetical protein
VVGRDLNATTPTIKGILIFAMEIGEFSHTQWSKYLRFRVGQYPYIVDTKKPYEGYGLPSPAIRIHIASASPA